MDIMDCGIIIVVLLAIIESGSIYVLMPLLLGYIVGMILKPASGYYTAKAIRNKRMQIELSVALCVLVGVPDITLASQTVWFIFIINNISDDFISRKIRGIFGSFNMNVTLSVLIAMILCIDYRVCCYAVAGIFIGYTMALLKDLTKSINHNYGEE